jgi:hypothetical protein
MSMPISDANDLNTVLLWAMGRRVRYPGGPPVTDEDATAAARRLAAKAQKALMAGLYPEQVELTRDGPADAQVLEAARTVLNRRYPGTRPRDIDDSIALLGRAARTARRNDAVLP